jgi:hypothetical protein
MVVSKLMLPAPKPQIITWHLPAICLIYGII